MSFKALHSAMLDQVDDAIKHLRASVPPEVYTFRDPDRPQSYMPLPEEELVGYPTERHASLIEIAPNPQRPGRITALHWWPALDPLCELRDRWRLYHEDIA